MDNRTHQRIGWVGALGTLALVILIAHAPGDATDEALGSTQNAGLRYVPDTATVVFIPPITYLTEAPDSAWVGVGIDGATTDLKGFSLAIDFDTGFVKPSSVAAGSLLTNAGCSYFFEWRNDGIPSWEPGIGDSVFVDGALLGDCAVAGPGELFRIFFVKSHIGIGGCDLTCSGPRMRNSVNDSFAVLCETGSIIAPIQVETRSWGRIKAEYR